VKRRKGREKRINSWNVVDSCNDRTEAWVPSPLHILYVFSTLFVFSKLLFILYSKFLQHPVQNTCSIDLVSGDVSFNRNVMEVEGNCPKLIFWTILSKI